MTNTQITALKRKLKANQHFHFPGTMVEMDIFVTPQRKYMVETYYKPDTQFANRLSNRPEAYIVNSEVYDISEEYRSYKEMEKALINNEI